MQRCQDADTDLERAPRYVTKAGGQLLLVRVCGKPQVAQLQGRMLEHERKKLQGGDLRVRQQLRIGPIKRLFDTLWRYRQANLGVEPVEARQPMHTGGIQRATEVKEHSINALHVHSGSLSSRLSNSAP